VQFDHELSQLEQLPEEGLGRTGKGHFQEGQCVQEVDGVGGRTDRLGRFGDIQLGDSSESGLALSFENPVTLSDPSHEGFIGITVLDLPQQIVLAAASVGETSVLPTAAASWWRGPCGVGLPRFHSGSS
jgi:hypothetical protein